MANGDESLSPKDKAGPIAEAWGLISHSAVVPSRRRQK